MLETGIGPSQFLLKTSIDEVRSLSSRSLTKSSLTAVYVKRTTPGIDLAQSRIDDSFYMSVHLRQMEAGDLWRNGRYLGRPRLEAGEIKIWDAREQWISDLGKPFECVYFFIPRSAFDELTASLKAPRIEELTFFNHVPCVDNVMTNLACAFLPAIWKPGEISGLFADHVFAAVRLHVAQTYGGLRLRDTPRRGGLTPIQERRVRDRILDDLKGDPSLVELAALCGLSRSYFVRAFKGSMGMPPHRWLLTQRVERAKNLLAETDLTVGHVALECGFADQSHLTRVFSKATGIGPGAWRRSRL
jgi:AraC family transcriptional regulator